MTDDVSNKSDYDDLPQNDQLMINFEAVLRVFDVAKHFVRCKSSNDKATALST